MNGESRSDDKYPRSKLLYAAITRLDKDRSQTFEEWDETSQDLKETLEAAINECFPLAAVSAERRGPLIALVDAVGHAELVLREIPAYEGLKLFEQFPGLRRAYEKALALCAHAPVSSELSSADVQSAIDAMQFFKRNRGERVPSMAELDEWSALLRRLDQRPPIAASHERSNDAD